MRRTNRVRVSPRVTAEISARVIGIGRQDIVCVPYFVHMSVALYSVLEYNGSNPFRVEKRLIV